MDDVGACWNNAVVERFLGILKHDWVLRILQPTRKQMKEDVAEYALLQPRKASYCSSHLV